MDWDGIGTFAAFLSAGAVTMGWIVLAGYKAKLKAESEQRRLGAASGEAIEELRRETHDALREQQQQLDELHERLDFAERLLTRGQGAERPPKRESTPT